MHLNVVSTSFSDNNIHTNLWKTENKSTLCDQLLDVLVNIYGKAWTKRKYCLWQKGISNCIASRNKV